MDKYIEVFCKKNPKTTLKCNNKECKFSFVVDTKDVFSVKEYKHTCEKCGIESTYEMQANFVKQLKSIGVIVK